MTKEETTFYRFYSEIRSFLSKLISDPIKAQPSKYLKDRDFNKTRLINVLISRQVLERNESIKDQTNSDEKKPTYYVKYKVRKKDFEKRIHRMYIKYFEKNEPKKETELDEASGCGAVGGANGMGYDVVAFQNKPMKQATLYEHEVKSVFANEDEEIEKLKKLEPAYITRGGLKETSKKKKNNPVRKVRFSEKMFEYIQDTINSNNAGDAYMEGGIEESTTTTNIGTAGNYTANGLVLKTSDGKPDPAYRR